MERNDAKAKLLEAAVSVFAEMGYRAATVRDICNRAGANVAAINYHFGDKLALYTEVLKDSTAPAMQKKIRAAVADSKSPEKQFRAFVRGMFEKMLGSDRPACHLRIIMQELANPTPALPKVVSQVIRPQYKQLCEVVGAAIGQPPASTSTRLCVHSLVGQTYYYVNARAVLSQLWPEFKMEPRQLNEIADHIVRFTLAGIAGVRKGNRL